MTHTLLSLALVLGLFGQAKPNFEYTSWSGFKAGSWVKYKVDTSAAGVAISMKGTTTLVSFLEEKAVVEKVTTILENGQEQKGKDPQREEISAKEAKDSIRIVKEKGEEQIEVGGKKLKCRVVEAMRDKDGMRMTMKMWTSKEIPGGIAKMESTVAGNKATAQLVVLEWEKK